MKQRAKCCYSQEIAVSDVISPLGRKGKLSKSLRDLLSQQIICMCLFLSCKSILLLCSTKQDFRRGKRVEVWCETFIENKMCYTN